MSKQTLTPFDSASTQITLTKVSDKDARFLVAGRTFSTPYGAEVVRKITPANQTGNDHISLRVFRTERNTTSSKLATAQAMLDISIPKDQSILDKNEQLKLLAVLCSLLRDETLMSATNANNTALLEGRDL